MYHFFVSVCGPLPQDKKSSGGPSNHLSTGQPLLRLSGKIDKVLERQPRAYALVSTDHKLMYSIPPEVKCYDFSNIAILESHP